MSFFEGFFFCFRVFVSDEFSIALSSVGDGWFSSGSCVNIFIFYYYARARTRVKSVPATRDHIIIIVIIGRWGAATRIRLLLLLLYFLQESIRRVGTIELRWRTNNGYSHAVIHIRFKLRWSYDRDGITILYYNILS